MGKKLPKVITQEEVEKLINKTIRLEKFSKSKGAKRRFREYRIAILLGFESGLRISEILGYENNGVMIVPPLTETNIEDKWIRIISGKGGKDRITRRPKRFTQKAVSILPLKVKRRALQHFIKNIGKEILGKEISFHTLRHGFCSHLANQNVPLHEIQMMAGHSRLDTTGIYLHANPMKAIERCYDIF